MTDNTPTSGFPGEGNEGLPLLPLAPEEQTFLERQGISPILFGFIALLVIFVLYQFVAGITTVLLFGLKPGAEDVTGMRIATAVSQLLFILVPSILMVRLATRTPSAYVRLRFPGIGALLIPFVGMFALQQMLQVLLVLQEKIPLPESLQRFLDPLKDMIEEMYRLLVGSSSIPELLFVIFVIALVPALAEEFLFRGLVQRSFERGMGVTKGMIVTGIIFGAYHLNPFTFIPLAILGVYLGFLVVRANSLWVSVAAHFYNNVIACVALYLNMDEDSIITGDPSQMSGMALLSTFMLFAAIFIVANAAFLQVTRRANPDVPDAGAGSLPDGTTAL